MRTIYEQTKTNPQLADKAILAVNSALKDNLWWLDQAFGRAWPITKTYNGNHRQTLPAVYTTGNSYESVIPSSDLGNYSFFQIHDAATVDTYDQVLRIPYSLIVWYDLRKVFANGDTNRRDTDNIKNDILSCLLHKVWMRNGSISVTKVWEDAKNVWKGYTMDETNNQFMMQPFAAMRFEGEFAVDLPCE